MCRLLSALLMVALASSFAACGPSTEPGEPGCGTEDVDTEAEVVFGNDGSSCNPCPADAELFISTTLSTECGPVEWTTSSTCLVGTVRATRASDGVVYDLPPRLCGSAFRDWSVVPGEPLVVQEIAVSDVFGVTPIPAGTYAFEVVFPQLLSIEPATFEVVVD
ncbi:MAG: hypothetical protein KDK70_16390 [Myxococcales bacterium]|nr:hypothetical protein [Myxococcales bacterium]